MIRIKNIYYMLTYAFKVLTEDTYASIASEEFEHVEDLLASILSKAIASQIKRGLGKEYILKRQRVSAPHGKIDLSLSIKANTMQKRQLACEFDEFSENNYTNQILKTSAMLLIRSNAVKAEQKKLLKKLMLYFSDIDVIKAKDIKWSSIRYHRSNATYKMLMSICYLINEALLPTSEQGANRMMQFKDDHMNLLYERFVREYYKKHYPHFTVSAPHINWLVDNGVTDFLPQMKSDIVIENAKQTLIIDTKYYGQMMQAHSLFNSRSVHSGNLYQIFAYVKNKDINHTGRVSGLLLYAQTENEIAPNYRYLMSGNKISVLSLDLNQDFPVIRKQLDTIIEEWEDEI